MLQISPFRSRLHWLTALAASCALILGGAHADAVEAPKLSDRPDLNEAQTALAGAVQYLDETQQKVTAPDGEDFFSGEWPSYMMSTKNIRFVGRANHGGYDSNNFTVSSIHNILAPIHQRQPWLTQIPAILDLSMERILTYRTGDSFNFWPLLSPKTYWSKVPGFEKIRRPNHFKIKHPTLEAGCNVPNDADDTAVAFTAMRNYNEVRPERSVELPKAIGPVFTPWRDLNRPIPHFYNALTGVAGTGAFMTWLWPERSLNPITYWPSKRRLYIPYGFNDVDCVVNANVLNALASYSELDTPGVEQACAFINWAFETGRQHSCGVYYPSPYNAHYVVAKAYHAGATCVKPALDLAISEILAKQRADGSWASHIDQDDVHTSLYALNTLLYAGDAQSRGTATAIDAGVRSTLQTRQTRANGAVAWEPGVFFSGGTFARYWIFWRSEPYTTALGAEALSLYLKQREAN